MLNTPGRIVFKNVNGAQTWAKTYSRDISLNDFAAEIENVKILIGQDSVEFEVYYGFGVLKPSMSVFGHVKANLQGLDFSHLDDSILANFGFRFERDGLYAEFKDQDKIEEGIYTIRTSCYLDYSIESGDRGDLVYINRNEEGNRD